MWLDANLVCFAPFLFFPRDQQARVGSLLLTEEFFSGTSLLLNAQRKHHEGEFDRYLRTSIYWQIGK